MTITFSATYNNNCSLVFTCVLLFILNRITNEYI